MNKMGFIGYGALGQLLGDGFSDNYNVGYYDPKVPKDNYKKYKSITELVNNSEVIIIATPASSFYEVIKELSYLDLKNKLVVDVLSTKTFVKNIYQELLPNHSEILSLHPLFGPPSFNKIVPKARIVICFKVGKMANSFEQTLRNKYDLSIIYKSPDAHDKHMAYHHVIPFILAHALTKTDFNKDPGDLTIPSEEKLRKIVDIAGKESIDLYFTIMRSNPYAKSAVNDLLKSIELEQQKLWPK